MPRFTARDGSAPVKLENVQRKVGGSGSSLKFVKKICHKWTNMKLRQRAKAEGGEFEPIESPDDMIEAYDSGVLLANILEQLEPGRRIRVKKNARFPLVKKDNLIQCFNAIDAMDIPHKGIAADDFLSKNEKYVCTLLWNLIERYDYPKSAKMIIKWFNKRIKPFGYEVDLLDAAKGCVDGIPFNALVESQKSQTGTFDVPNLPNDPVGNMTNAFNHLLEQFEVDPLLDPADVANSDVDDMQLVVYLKQVKAAFDAEIVDIEPESLDYPGAPFVFCPGEELGDGIEPIVGPEDVDNLDWIVEPDLPDGMFLDDLTGALMGCPTPAACCDATEFVVTAENSSGSIQCSISIMVREIEPTGIAFEADDINCTVGVPIEPTVLPHVEPVDTKVTYEIAPDLASGLVFDPETGGISGTPDLFDTGDARTGLTTSHAVTAMNSGGSVSTNIVVNVTHQPPAEFEGWNETLTVGEAKVIETGVEQQTPIVWELSPDNLAEGLVFDNVIGTLSGTAVSPLEETSLSLTATNSGGTVTRECTLNIIDQPPSEILYDPIVAVADVGITEGGAAPSLTPETPVSFSIEPALPAGLVFDEGTGAVTGVPDESGVGDSEYTVTATNTGGSASTTLAISILDKPPSDLCYDGDNTLTFAMHKEVSVTPVYTGKGAFSVEPKLPAGLELLEDGTIAGMAEDPSLFKTSSTHVVTLGNSGGECVAEVTISFSDSKREFFEYVDTHKSDFINDLEKCVAIPSITDEQTALDNVSTWVKDYAKDKLNTDAQILGSDVLGFTVNDHDSNKKTLCVYGHLDVLDPQSPDFFRLSVSDRSLSGAGVANAKGPMVAWLSCAQAYVALGKEFPVNLKFLVENSGVTSSEKLQAAIKSQLGADFIADVDYFCVSGTNWLTPDKPCLSYGLRGFVHVKGVVVQKSGRASKSGAAGGTIQEPMADVAAFLSTLGSLDFPFVNDCCELVQPLEEIQFEVPSYSQFDDKVQHLNALWNSASLTVHGVRTEATFPASHIASHTIPNQVDFEFSVRLVDGQTSDSVVEAIMSAKPTLDKNDLELSVNVQVEPFVGVVGDENNQAAVGAITEVFGEPDFIKDGITIAAASFLRTTGKSVCLLPIGADVDESDSVLISSFSESIKVMGVYMENLK